MAQSSISKYDHDRPSSIFDPTNSSKGPLQVIGSMSEGIIGWFSFSAETMQSLAFTFVPKNHTGSFSGRGQDMGIIKYIVNQNKEMVQ